MIRILSVQGVAERGGSDFCMLGMLRSLPAEEFETHVVVPSEPPLRQEFEAAGATVHILPMRRITTQGGLAWWVLYALEWPLTVLRLAQLVRRLRIGVVHTNSLHSWYAWAAAWWTRRPHVWSAREIAVQSPAAARLERFLTRQFATVVVSMSRAIAARLEPRDSRVIVDDVDPDRFHPRRAGVFRRAHGIPDDAVLVGAAGRIDTWKGFEVLLEAHERVCKRRADIHLAVCGPAVIGKEDYEARLRRRAGSLPNVHWLGLVKDINAFHADLDVFVLPSTAPEPFGLVLLEALASGVPVIATHHGGPAELLDGHAERGNLVTPGDPAALAEAISTLLDRLPLPSTAATRCARPRRWQPSVPAYAALFRGVARKR